MEDIVAHNRVSPSTLTSLNKKYPSLGSYKAAQERQTQELERIQAKYPKLTEKRKSTLEATKRPSLQGREPSRERSNQRNSDHRKLSKGEGTQDVCNIREKGGQRKKYSNSQEPKFSKEGEMKIAQAQVHQ